MSHPCPANPTSTDDFPSRPHKQHKPPLATDFFCGAGPGSALSSLGRILDLQAAAAGAGFRRLAQQGLAWAPTAGNACTLLAFALGAWLNLHLTGGAPEPVFALAALLLLLSRDPLLLPRMQEAQRYFPPVLAATCYLVVLSVAETVQQARWGASRGALGLLLQLPLIAAGLAPHVLFLGHLWAPRARPAALLGVVAAATLLPLALSELEAVAYLAASGLAMMAFQFFSMRHLRQIGMRAL